MTGVGPFEGKVVLVTGGSRGIGRAVACAFAQHGADIAFSYRQDAESARGTSAEVERLGRRCLAVQSDAGVPDEATRLADRVTSELGRVDVTVANAGIVGPLGWESVPREEWREVLDTNLVGPYAVIRATASELKRNRGSAIVVASIAGFAAFPEEIAYSTAKAAVISLTRSLALALAPDVRVNALAPGWVKTDMTAALYTHPRFEGAIRRRIPRGRWGEPRDVVAGALFLASDGARFITGETLVVDGGNVLEWGMSRAR